MRPRSASDPAPGGGAHTALVLQTHYADRQLIAFFERLRAEAPAGYEPFLLLHASDPTAVPARLREVPHMVVATSELRNPAYVAKVGKSPGWHFWQGGHTDLLALYVYSRRPHFARYWFIEYDMRFSGSWRAFFEGLDDDPAELVTTTIRRAVEDPDWMHWRSLHVPAAERWPEHAETLAAFMPIFRVSARALGEIDAAYRRGWAGHCELTWPTIVHRAGLAISDIGGDGAFVPEGRRNRFYTNTPRNRDLRPGSLVFRPARMWAGGAPGMLWHPVKPPYFKIREDLRRVWVNCKQRLGMGVRMAQPPQAAATTAPGPERA